MKITISVIKAGIGSIGGHIAPSQKLLETVRKHIETCGGMRGSHQMPLMPVRLNSGISYFDGPPVVSCAAFAIRNGKLTEALDTFAHPFWDTVRNEVANKAMSMRKQGFFGASMLPMSELEYTGIMEKLAVLEERFVVRS